MTIKEACLKALESEKRTFNYKEVYATIVKNKFYVWEKALTPIDTVSAQLGDFIRSKDNRVKRVKGKKGFEYYWAKYEDELNITAIADVAPASKTDRYSERDLHMVLSTYLNSIGILSKTIFHEKSTNSKDSNLNWIHPDMVGIHFLELKEKSSQALLKQVNKGETFNISSYELKKEIKNDYELKQFFFQAVSNSSWANYGYLVAFEIAPNLTEELERLSQAFGIGVIELKADAHTSEELYPSKYRDLDFRTIDKLSHANPNFREFITLADTILDAKDKYVDASKKMFTAFCDDYLGSQSEIQDYCEKHHIPIEKASIDKNIKAS